MEAFKKTFRLGFATWGGVFLVSLLMGIIANVLQGVTMMPWYIATVVKYFFAMSDVGGSGEVTVLNGDYSDIRRLPGNDFHLCRHGLSIRARLGSGGQHYGGN